MTTRSKFFRIAVEGGTTDGRTIDRSMIEDAAANFDTANYTPRINCEHISGYSPEPPFNAYGSVTGLKAEEIDFSLDGKTEKRLALFAEIEPNEQLLAINAKNQKIFTSCEFRPNYGGTGKWGLTGLAVTDNPASLGTEMLQFSAQAGAASPLAARKSHPDALFTEAVEVPGDAFAGTPAATSAGGSAELAEMRGFFASIRKFFDLGAAAEDAGNAASQQPAPATPSSPASAAPSGAGGGTDFAKLAGAMTEGMEKLAAAMEKQGQSFAASVDQLRRDHNTLKASVETTADPNQAQRPPAGGGNASYVATEF